MTSRILLTVGVALLIAVPLAQAQDAQPVLPTGPATAEPPANEGTALQPDGAAQPIPSGEATSDFDLLKAQIIQKCRDTVQPDVLQFVTTMFGMCQASAAREEEMLKSLMESKTAMLQRIQALQAKVDAAASELATLDQRRADLERQIQDQQQAFAAGGMAPSEGTMESLETVVADIARKKTAQHEVLKTYYKMPRPTHLQSEIAEAQKKVAAAQAVQKRWADAAREADDAIEAVSNKPKTIPLRQLIASHGRLEKPACNVSKHWLAQGSKFNLFLMQMDDGQVIGGGMQPEPVQVYEVFGFVYGKKLSLLLVNKHDESDVLAFSGAVTATPNTGEATELKGKLKQESDTGEGQEWVFK